MGGDWSQVSFGSLCEHSAFGPRFSGDLYATDGNVATLRTTDISEDGRIEYRTMPLACLDLTKLAQHVLRKDDLVITRTGRVGTVAVYQDFHLPVLPGAFLIRFRLRRDVADPNFYRYFFNSPDGRQLVSSVATGSVQQNLNITSLHGLHVPRPPLSTQRAIAHILGTLDDKIELNRRMNETLEAMARAIFKSWFVDFDPVRAKMDGRRPAGMDAATARLFPDCFEDSELGLIPKGWRVDSIKARTSDIQYGLTQSATSEPVGPRFLRITDIRGGRVDWASVPFCEASPLDYKKYRICDGDVFVARTGASTGDNVRVVDPPDSVFASYLVRFRFREAAMSRFVGEFMRTDAYADYVAGSIGGSAQPNASAQVLAGAKLVLPTDDVAKHFHNIVEPLDRRCAANARELSRLSILRDTLLPMLLSGNLRIEKTAI